jgi:hypothetical protein
MEALKLFYHNYSVKVALNTVILTLSLISTHTIVIHIDPMVYQYVFRLQVYMCHLWPWGFQLYKD